MPAHRSYHSSPSPIRRERRRLSPQNISILVYKQGLPILIPGDPSPVFFDNLQMQKLQPVTGFNFSNNKKGKRTKGMSLLLICQPVFGEETVTVTGRENPTPGFIKGGGRVNTELFLHGAVLLFCTKDSSSVPPAKKLTVFKLAFFIHEQGRGMKRKLTTWGSVWTSCCNLSSRSSSPPPKRRRDVDARLEPLKK